MFECNNFSGSLETGTILMRVLEEFWMFCRCFFLCFALARVKRTNFFVWILTSTLWFFFTFFWYRKLTFRDKFVERLSALRVSIGNTDDTSASAGFDDVKNAEIRNTFRQSSAGITVSARSFWRSTSAVRGVSARFSRTAFHLFRSSNDPLAETSPVTLFAAVEVD